MVRMDSKIESALRMYSRLRQLPESVDEQVFDSNNIVTIMNSSDGHLIACNHLIYNTCKLVLNSLSADMVSEANLCGERMIIDDNYETSSPSIVIYDGMKSFQVIQFSTLLANVALMSRIVIRTCNDDTQLLLDLNTDFRHHLALNQNLKLIVIYANSCILYPKLFDSVLYVLKSFPLSVRVILVVDRITKSQSKMLDKLCSYQTISCKLLAINQIEIKKNSDDKALIRQIKQNVGYIL